MHTTTSTDYSLSQTAVQAFQCGNHGEPVSELLLCVTPIDLNKAYHQTTGKYPRPLLEDYWLVGVVEPITKVFLYASVTDQVTLPSCTQAMQEAARTAFKASGLPDMLYISLDEFDPNTFAGALGSVGRYVEVLPVSWLDKSWLRDDFRKIADEVGLSIVAEGADWVSNVRVHPSAWDRCVKWALNQVMAHHHDGASSGSNRSPKARWQSLRQSELPTVTALDA